MKSAERRKRKKGRINKLEMRIDKLSKEERREKRVEKKKLNFYLVKL